MLPPIPLRTLNTKLATLDKDLELAKDRERILMEEVHTAGTLQKDAELKLNDQVDLYDLWSKSLVNIVECISSQITKMNMKSWTFSVNEHEAPSVKLTHFFEGLIDGLKTYEDDIFACFTNESWKFAQAAIFTILVNFAQRYPDVDLSDAFKKLLARMNTSAMAQVV